MSASEYCLQIYSAAGAAIYRMDFNPTRERKIKGFCSQEIARLGVVYNLLY